MLFNSYIVHYRYILETYEEQLPLGTTVTLLEVGSLVAVNHPERIGAVPKGHRTAGF